MSIGLEKKMAVDIKSEEQYSRIIKKLKNLGVKVSKYCYYEKYFPNICVGERGYIDGLVRRGASADYHWRTEEDFIKRAEITVSQKLQIK